MYRLGETRRSHRKKYIWLLAIISVLGGAGYLAVSFLQPNTEIQNTATMTTRTVSYDAVAPITLDEPLFTMKLPNDWKRVANTNTYPQPSYTWQGMSKANSARTLQLFIDKMPTLTGFAVNRELYVQANGDNLTVLSDVSDNCIKFTGSANIQGHGNVPAKWQGIDFLCDTGNYERNVVGTASPDGLNSVSITGQTKGIHKFFFVYTDNSAAPDYSIFTAALRSFAVK